MRICLRGKSILAYGWAPASHSRSLLRSPLPPVALPRPSEARGAHIPCRPSSHFNGNGLWFSITSPRRFPEIREETAQALREKEPFAARDVGARVGPVENEPHENCADWAADGERAPPALWRDGANRGLPDRGAGPAGPRGHVVCERRLDHQRETGSLRAHGAAARFKCARSHP